MPCILVENKADLLDKNEIDNTQELEEFSEYNGFDCFFRTSAKTGLNVNKAMEYLINNIIKRLDIMEIYEGKITNVERENENKEDKNNNQKKEESIGDNE